MAFSDAYRESIQSKHLANVGFTSTAKGVTNEANPTKNPHQLNAGQIPALDVVSTYGPLTASGIAAGVAEEHIVKLTPDPTVNNSQAWLAFEDNCITAGHSSRSGVRLDQWMRYAETQYKLRLFADNGSETGPNYSSEILPSYTGFNWEYDASAGIVYFDADPSGAFTTPLWGVLYTYTGETIADKLGSTSSGTAAYDVFKNVSDGVNTAVAAGIDDTLTMTGAGAIDVTITPGTDTVTISADVYKTITDGVTSTVASGDDTLTVSGTGAADVTVTSGTVTYNVDAFTSMSDGSNTASATGADTFSFEGTGTVDVTVDGVSDKLTINGDAFAFITDGTTSGTASGADLLTFEGAGYTTVTVDGGTNKVTISSTAHNHYDIELGYVSGNIWDSSGVTFTTVPSGLVVFVNGVKQKSNDSDYYTASIDSNNLRVEFDFTVGADNWVNAEYIGD